MDKQLHDEAPGWVLPILIMVMLTMQLSVKAEDVKAQRVDVLHGETLKTWNELEGPDNRECK